uniref:Large ribosomal subunit protein uL24c n=1 Tax=Calliarthron tuberculosum TaxID=48942 RepID=M4IUY6_CALTB|nr:50S ribosomal protein L24 [Calliarthron tuberculosum]AGA63829.1 50S ribosomal protein L24 [Calliarthron tuberculosum]
MIKKSKIHVKKGDTVQIISGRQKGEIGVILKILTKTSQVIVKNLNLKIKHVRKNQEEESGKIINFEAPIHSSNIMLYSIKNKTKSRYKIKVNENNEKYRILHKTNEIIK